MDLSTSIAMFLGLAIGLLVLFCLVTKYFQYRMNKKFEQQGQVYSQVDQITQQSQEDIQGQYDQFLEKRKTQTKQNRDSTTKKRKKQQEYMFQNTQIQSPMKDHTDLIYGVSMLRRRLDGEVLPMKQQTGRSMHSAKSFRPQRLHTGRQSVPSQRGFINKPQEALTIHEFVSKLISYKEQGIQILQVNVVSLCKKNGKVLEKKTLNSTNISPKDLGFIDQLQVLGFESKQYSCCKSKARVEIPFMIQNQQYKISSLKISQSKDQIDFSQYYLLKDKIQNSLS